MGRTHAVPYLSAIGRQTKDVDRDKQYYLFGVAVLTLSMLSLRLGWGEQLLGLTSWAPLSSWSFAHMPAVSWWHLPLTILAVALSLRLCVYHQLLNALGRSILCMVYPTLALLSCTGTLWLDALLLLLPIGLTSLLLTTFSQKVASHVYLPLGMCTAICTLTLGIEYLALLPLFTIYMISMRAWSLRNVFALLWGIIITPILVAPAMYLLLGAEGCLAYLQELATPQLGGIKAYSDGLFVGHRFAFLAHLVLSYLILLILEPEWMRRQSIRLRASYALLTVTAGLTLVLTLAFGQISGGFALMAALPYSLLLSSHLAQGSARIYRYIIPSVALILSVLTLLP